MKTKNGGLRIARQVRAQGIRVDQTKDGFRAYGADGRTTVGWHRSPARANRGYANLKSNLKRIGVQI